MTAAAVHGMDAAGGDEAEANRRHAEALKAAVRQRTLAGWFPVTDAVAPPGPVARIGVVGAGVMGAGIAQWCAAHGHEVVMRDVDAGRVEWGLAAARGLFDGAVARGHLTCEAAGAGRARLRGVTGWTGFDECDLVIEAIAEDTAAKRALFAELARVVRRDCLLASNTSALPIEGLTAAVPDAERTIGLHFFNPVSRMPLVELVLSPHTSRATAERALALVRGLGKSAVICRSSPGFLVTRVLFFYLNTACRLWEQGVPVAALDPAMRAWGWPMGPMRLMDEVGLDVTAHIFDELQQFFPDRFDRAGICARLAAAGLKGRKSGTGSGFYIHDGRAEASNPALARFAPVGCRMMAPEAVASQLMAVMVGEARKCLDEGVVKSPDDVDAALLLGAGFPAVRGGLMHWAAGAGARH